MLFIGDLLRRRAEGGDAGHTAVIIDEEQWTYARLNAAVNRLANGLRHLGIRRGDRVALLGRNSAAWIVSYFAAAKAGAILVPASYWFKEDELTYVLRDSGARLLVAAGEYAGLVGTIRAGVPDLREVIWLDATPAEAGLPINEVTERSPADEPDVPLAEIDGHIIMYTSGTTGRPKGVLLSHRAHVLHAATWAYETRASRSDVYLCTYPLFHTGGTDCGILPPLYAGATVVVLPWPDVTAILDAVERHHVSAFRAVPTVWKRLLAQPDLEQRDLSSLRRVVSGSDAIPPELILEIRRRLPQASYLQTYGLTEAGPVLTYLRPEDPPEKYGSNGTPDPWSEVRIVDQDGLPVPDGTIGEIVARSEHLMTEYWQLPEAMAQTFRSGWLRTGDLGYLDNDGYLWVTGRQKDVIITGSEHVYPAEVEATLRLHPAVEEVAVIGIPDAEWGESVAAIVIPRAGAALNEAELSGFVRHRLAAFKRPKYVVFVEDLPRTGPTRKIQKAVLRERYGNLAKSQAPVAREHNSGRRP